MEEKVNDVIEVGVETLNVSIKKNEVKFAVSEILNIFVHK